MSSGTIDGTSRPFQDVAPDEAARLLAAGAVALDVRTEREHEEEGHIPGSLLLPLPLLASGPAVLPDDGRPLVVYCADGIRSFRAVRRLGDAGLGNLHNLKGGMKAWEGAVARGMSPVSGPSSWLVANSSLVPPGARTLDVACGRGRHALLLAAAGNMVRAIDRDPDRIQWLQALSRRLRLPIDATVVDLEESGPDLGEDEWDLVLVFRYLHRPLFPALVRAVRPGGVLLCETFLQGGPAGTSPRNPDYLLKPGELAALVRPLEVVRQREGAYDGQRLASIAARKPLTTPGTRP